MKSARAQALEEIRAILEQDVPLHEAEQIVKKLYKEYVEEGK